MTNKSSMYRVTASVLLVFVLLAVVNIVQAVAVSRAFGADAWSSGQIWIDLLTRLLVFALAAFAGAAIARDRAIVVAAMAAGGALVFGLLNMATSSLPLTIYNYLSLGALVSGTALGAVAWWVILRAAAERKH